MTNFMPRAHSLAASGVLNFWSSALADGADGAIADDGELGADIHAGHEAVGGRAGLVDALIGEAKAGDGVALEERSGDGRAGPDLDQAGGHELRGDPLVELADGEDEAAVLVEEGGCPGEGEGVVFDEEVAAETEDKIGDARG